RSRTASSGAWRSGRNSPRPDAAKPPPQDVGPRPVAVWMYGGCEGADTIHRAVARARMDVSGIDARVRPADPRERMPSVGRLAVPHPGGARRGEETMSTIETLQAFFDNGWNRHDVDLLMAFMSEDCVFESAAGPEACGTRHAGRERVREAFAGIFAAFPDVHFADL